MCNENNMVIMRPLFECTIDILGIAVGIKIYEDSGIYSFTQSHYIQDETDLLDVYKPGDGAVDDDLEGLLYKINLLKKHYRRIVKTETNPNF